MRPPAPAEVLAAIEGADPEFAVFIRVAAAAGSRRGEVGVLRWPAVDMEGKQLVISKELIESSTRAIRKDTKTHQARRIALDAGTVAALRAWREECDRRAALCGVAVLPDGYVFSAQPDGSEPWRPYRWTSAWRRLRDRAGIDKSVRLHDLRHFRATRLLDAGVPVKTVSGRLGHARPATALHIYAHFVPATDRLAADSMGRILSRSRCRRRLPPSRTRRTRRRTARTSELPTRCPISRSTGRIDECGSNGTDRLGRRGC